METDSKGTMASVEPGCLDDADPQQVASGSNRNRKVLLDELRIERAGRSVRGAARRSGKATRKGLLLGATVLAIGSGVVAVSWGTILAEDSGAPQEPMSQREKRHDLEPHVTSDPTGEPASQAEPRTTPGDRPGGAVAASRTASVLDATGYVVARRKATVSARITGKLASVFVEEGDRVKSGQVIALLDDSAAQAELALAESRLIAAKSRGRELQISIDHAGKRVARSEELAKRRLVSEERLDDDRLAREALIAKLHNLKQEIEVARRERKVHEVNVADTRIRAPFSGVVIDKSAHPGEVVSPMSGGGGFTRSGIGTIVDMDSLEVEVDINEAYLNRVFANQPATVRLNAYPNRGYGAAVAAIVPTADRNKATVQVRIGLMEKDERVLPNMGVQVEFFGRVGKESPTQIDQSE
ncbi:MAG: efflux RND transporter periplasmic adaptor subunit [Gammaproteobacteria bacterium]|nr:efflux RND transporter periplasmic adaptor subunit [Gammaproteobacteria bacterium]MYB37548.1 efflux RND transporter periplasmic adaptor subunit [Gammaproteobacteria bacterium]